MKEISDTNFKFNLGSIAKCKITGFEGMIIYRSQWLNNCNVYGVKPTTLKDGLPIDSVQFDEPQLELIKKDVIPPSRSTGGPEKSIPTPNRM